MTDFIPYREALRRQRRYSLVNEISNLIVFIMIVGSMYFQLKSQKIIQQSNESVIAALREAGTR